jgi:hypothetical protein
MALQRVHIPSPNYSSRGGSSVRLIVCHTTQGASNYQDLGAFFANPSSGVSSHVGVDDTPSVVGEYVPRSGKAWTQGNANPYCVAAELCAWAEWTAGEWADHSQMLDNTAQWIAEEAQYFGIPIRALSAGEAQGGVAGVCQHADLGAAGGGHWDCGSGFPMAEVIDAAITYALGGTPVPEAPEGGDDDVFIRSSDDRVRWFIPDGQKSYWRVIPQGCEQDITDRIVKDPNDSWLNLWDH